MLSGLIPWLFCASGSAPPSSKTLTTSPLPPRTSNKHRERCFPERISGIYVSPGGKKRLCGRRVLPLRREVKGREPGLIGKVHIGSGRDHLLDTLKVALKCGVAQGPNGQRDQGPAPSPDRDRPSALF
jgi:hypothetical protein